jgi:hypothetical protein
MAKQQPMLAKETGKGRVTLLSLASLLAKYLIHLPLHHPPILLLNVTLLPRRQRLQFPANSYQETILFIVLIPISS